MVGTVIMAFFFSFHHQKTPLKYFSSSLMGFILGKISVYQTTCISYKAIHLTNSYYTKIHIATDESF